jgi:hypothetical protein
MMDWCLGRRAMQTFRKLPIASPKSMKKMAESKTTGGSIDADY